MYTALMRYERDARASRLALARSPEVSRVIQAVLIAVVVGGLNLAANIAEPPRSEFMPRVAAVDLSR